MFIMKKMKIHISYFYDKISKYNSNDCFALQLAFDKILKMAMRL